MAILLWVVFFWAHLLHLEMCTQLPPRDQASSLSQKCNRHKNKEKWWLVKNCNMCTFRQCTNIGQTTDGTLIIPTIRIHQHFYTQSTENIPHPLRKLQAFLHKSSLIFSLAKWHNKSLTWNSINFSRMISPECICINSWNILLIHIEYVNEIQGLRKSYLKIRLATSVMLSNPSLTANIGLHISYVLLIYRKMKQDPLHKYLTAFVEGKKNKF